MEEARRIYEEALIANETGYGEIKSSLRSLTSTIQRITNNAITVEKAFRDWMVREGIDSATAVQKICDVLEVEMKDQMDWFEGLERMVLSWCNKGSEEHRKYAENPHNPIPLLRQSSIEASLRILEEFQLHDIKSMFPDVLS